MTRRTKMIVAGAAVLLVGGLIARAAFKKPDIAYDTQKAERGTLRQTVQVTGAVTSSSDIDLKFELPGRVKSIDRKVGDTVKVGDILATLDDRTERVGVQKAQAAYLSAQANLNRILKGATPEDVRISEVAVANAQLALEQAKQAAADAAISNVATLEKAQADLDGQLETLFLKASTAMQVLKSDVFDATGILRNDFYNVNAALATQASAAYSAARSDFARMEADIAAYRTSDRAGKDLRVAALLAEGRSVRAATQLSNDLMQSSTPTSLTSEAAFDVRKGNVRAAWIDLNAAVNAAESQKSLVATTVTANAAGLNAANQSVRAAEGALESAKASLAFKQAPATSYDVESARASLTQASATLGEASLALDRTRIRAPFDGVIAAVLGRVGATVSSAEAILKLHGNGVYEIEADVPETDVAKLRVGMKASVTLDAYGDDVTFDGELATVDSAETVVQDVVYYKARFRFAAGERDVRTGMTASVTAVTIERPDTMIVPQRALREDDANGTKYVRVLENGAEVRRDVQIGVRGDDGLVEVTSGLSGGEDVILSIRENGQLKR